MSDIPNIFKLEYHMGKYIGKLEEISSVALLCSAQLIVIIMDTQQLKICIYKRKALHRSLHKKTEMAVLYTYVCIF